MTSGITCGRLEANTGLRFFIFSFTSSQSFLLLVPSFFNSASSQFQINMKTIFLYNNFYNKKKRNVQSKHPPMAIVTDFWYIPQQMGQLESHSHFWVDPSCLQHLWQCFSPSHNLEAWVSCIYKAEVSTGSWVLDSVEQGLLQMMMIMVNLLAIVLLCRYCHQKV